jgi:hypothetical protein
LSLTSHARASSVAESPGTTGRFFDCVEELEGVDGVVASGGSTSLQFIVIHSARLAVNEELVDENAEGAGEPVEDVETRVDDAALDVGDILATNTGGFRESGLREPGSGPLENEVPAKYLPRWRSCRRCPMDHA